MQASTPPLGCRSLFPPVPRDPSRCSPPFSALVALRSTLLSIRCAISEPASCQGFGTDTLCQKLLHPPPCTEKASPTAGSIESEVVEKRVAEIRRMLREGMGGGGEISASPYDTAWVALVRDGDGAPRFPSSLQWIAEQQLPDGSWGDWGLFEVHDRVMNTLACVLALRSYRVCAVHCARGMEFLRENMHRIGEGDEERMPIGFEMAFPSLVSMARALGLDLPFGAPGLEKIDQMRRLKMERIPKDVMHEVPTTLLHSLEGMATGGCGDDSDDLDWTRLLKLQCSDGSFLFSPSSTAFAVIQTGDAKSTRYLEDVTRRFGGGVPNVYPIDLFEHMWVVDRLQRLGVARYFEPEIDRCLDYVHRNWTEDGVGWASGSPVHDVDDTAMGFRLLRLHGYAVSADVFLSFRREGEFQCFAGQSSQAVSGIFNLHRAAQVAFAGEELLDEAARFSRAFLRKKQCTNQLVDKWIITKDLPGEVSYALDFPWHASLPRVEARAYLEQYGGEGDVWIGKTLYRMPLINNKSYLELAKADFNMCQEVHQREWLGLGRWFDESGLEECGVDGQRLMEAFFLASSSIFEPEKATQRLGWTRTAVLIEAARKLLGAGAHADEAKQDIVLGLRQCASDAATADGFACSSMDTTIGALVRNLCDTIHDISFEASLPQHTAIMWQHNWIRQRLCQAWEEWIMTIDEEGDGEALLLCRTIELCAGRFELEEALSSIDNIRHDTITTRSKEYKYLQAIALTSTICHGLRRFHHERGTSQCKTRGLEDNHDIYPLEREMRKLLQCVLQISNAESRDSMQTFLIVVKSFFYAAYCSEERMAVHISKVLFERIE